MNIIKQTSIHTVLLLWRWVYFHCIPYEKWYWFLVVTTVNSPCESLFFQLISIYLCFVIYFLLNILSYFSLVLVIFIFFPCMKIAKSWISKIMYQIFYIQNVILLSKIWTCQSNCFFRRLVEKFKWFLK